MIKRLFGYTLIGFACATAMLILHANSASAAVYYLSDSDGDDANNGTSTDTPWKSLNKASEVTYKEGDQLLLKSGDTWTGQTLTLLGSGTGNNPIVLSSYGKGDKPVIAPGIVDAICIMMRGLSGWSISGLEL